MKKIGRIAIHEDCFPIQTVYFVFSYQLIKFLKSVLESIVSCRYICDLKHTGISGVADPNYLSGFGS